MLLQFSGKGLVSDAQVHSLPFLTAVAGGAGATVILATRLGFPVSTTHALLGAMAGSALVAAFGAVNLGALGGQFTLPLLASPSAAMLVFRVLTGLRRHWPSAPNACLCEEETTLPLAARIGALTASWLDEPIRRFRFGSQAVCASREARVLIGLNRQRITDGLHFLSAGAVCFARGLNDTPKIAALLL